MRLRTITSYFSVSVNVIIHVRCSVNARETIFTNLEIIISRKVH